MSHHLGTPRPGWHRASLVVVAAIAGGCVGFFGVASLGSHWVHDDGLILMRGMSILSYAVIGMAIGALASATCAWWWSRARRSRP